MSGLWDQPGVPHKGWRCVGVDDLEEAIETCEMCGKENIRYVHYMEHGDHGSLSVGCVCAEKMSDDYVNPRKREKVLRNRASRKSRWLSRKWRVSRSGNTYINVEGHNIVVFVFKQGRHAGRRGFRMGGEWSQKGYETEDEAKLAAFDAFWAKTQGINLES